MATKKLKKDAIRATFYQVVREGLPGKVPFEL